MNQLSQFLLEPQLEFRMSPSFSLVSLFWCRVKLWHDVGIDPGSGAKRLLALGVQAGSLVGFL